MDSKRSAPADWPLKIAASVFGGALAYLLLTEHRAHVLQTLPWILLAACPLMHVFMHRGHGSSHEPGARRPGDGAR